MYKRHPQLISLHIDAQTAGMMMMMIMSYRMEDVKSIHSLMVWVGRRG